MSDSPENAPKAHGKLKRKKYERELERLHVELVKLQQWVVHKGLRVCIIFEGRDGAGKGGTIKAMTERVSPRIFRVVALPAPTEREKSQMYAQRYLPHLPAAGEIVIFDRSWYNRAGVERVLGFCTEEQAKHFLQIVPAMLPLRELDLWPLQLLVGDFAKDVSENVESCSSLVVGVDDIPRRPSRVAGVEHLVARPRIVIPARI